MTKVIILAGGEATRLRPLSCNLPKAMMPLLNTPFLEHVIVQLREHDIREMILALGVLPKQIEQHFGDGSRFGVRMSYAIEEQPLGTAGAIKNAERFFDDTFLVLNGDIFTDIDYTKIIGYHRSKKADVTISLIPVKDPTKYGLIETDDSGRITRFLEKPTPEQVTTNMINAGTYVMEPDVLKLIAPRVKVSIERETFPLLLERHDPAYAYHSDCYWIDIGTPEKYLQLHSDLLSGKSKRYAPLKGKEVNIGEACMIDPSANIEGAMVIGDNCKIGQDCRLTGPLAIGPGCEIMQGSDVTESVMWHDVRTGQGTSIRSTIIANNTIINDGCVLESSVIGDNVNLLEGTRLEPGSKIWPPGMEEG